jgi:peptide deformylase
LLDAASQRRTYVLDTSVLLSDPGALTAFDEHEVIVPLVVLTELEAKRHDPALGHNARTVLINPVLTPLGDETLDCWEGCLSVPGLRGQVTRWCRLRVQGFNGDGQAIDQVVEGFPARVVQHECDHLDGVLFPDRLCDPTAFGYIDELTAAGLIPAVPS